MASDAEAYDEKDRGEEDWWDKRLREAAPIPPPMPPTGRDSHGSIRDAPGFEPPEYRGLPSDPSVGTSSGAPLYAWLRSRNT